MPKSKRNRVVPLTKVKAKGREHREATVEKVRDAVAEYRYCYVVEIRRCNTKQLQAIREALKPEAKLIAGKNSLMQVALGTDPESSAHDDIYKLSGCLAGSTAVLAGNLDAQDLRVTLEANTLETFPVAGDVAPETVELPSGTEALARFPFSMETQLRALGLPTQLIDGKIHLLGNYTVCKAGSKLTTKQARLLKHLGHNFARFEVAILAGYDKETNKITIYDKNAVKARLEAKAAKAARAATEDGTDNAETEAEESVAMD